MSLKLEKIYVNNYKSFHNATFKLDDFNIVLGANNAGKSNFMDLLEFIEGALQDGLITAVKKKGGFGRIKNFRSKDDFVEITFVIKHLWSTQGVHAYPESFNYAEDFKNNYTIGFKVKKENIFLSKFKIDLKARVKELSTDEYLNLIAILKNDKFIQKRNTLLKDGININMRIDLTQEIEEVDEKLIRENLENGETLGQKKGIRKKYKDIDLVSKTENISFGRGTLEESIKIRVKNLEKVPRGHLVASLLHFFRIIRNLAVDFQTKKISHEKFIDSLESKSRPDDIISNLFKTHIFTYNFDVSSIRTSMREPGSLRLNKNGSNLHYLLDKLMNPDGKTDVFENIEAALTGVVEEVEEIRIEKQKTGTDIIPEILFMERKKFSVAREDISDGTLSLLSILTALFSDNVYAYLLAFEEPERHIHLSAISFLMELFRDHAKDKDNGNQVVLTTQSSEVLRNVNPDLDNMIFVYRDEEGFSKCVSSKEIAELKILIEKYDYDIDEIVRNEILGYLGDYEEDQ